MGKEQGTPVSGSIIDLPPIADLHDPRLPRVFKGWTDFSLNHAQQLSKIGTAQPGQVASLAQELSNTISKVIGVENERSSFSSISEEKVVQLTDIVSGEGNRIIFMRHGEQSPPEWITSLTDPALRKIRMMRDPFNKQDLLTNNGLVDVFVTALALLHVQVLTGRRARIFSSENLRAKEAAYIISTVISGSSVSTLEGLNSITYKDEIDQPSVTEEDLLTDLPSGMMPWDPQLVDKLCKRPKSGMSQSEAIINTIGGLVEYANRKNGNKLAIVVTHSQQIAEVLKETGKLDDPAKRFPELTMMVVRNGNLTILSTGVLEKIVPESIEIKTADQFIYSFDQIDDAMISQIGGKAANLVKLKKAGLSVPDGYCVTTDLHDYYIANGKIPANLINQIIGIKKALGDKIAIRSSANCEDGTQLSMAGVFESCYVYQDKEVGEAIEKILKQSRSEEVAGSLAMHGKSVKDVKMGLVIQKLIEPETAGVIYTGVNGNNILIQYTNGFGVGLVDGKTAGSAMIVDGNGVILQSTGYETRPLSPATVCQLSVYARMIESLYSDAPQDIEFANDKGGVHIVQARTLTTDLGKVELSESAKDCLELTKRKLKQLVAEEKQELGVKTAIFSDANYSELLPKPTEMDIGVYMYVWGGSDGIPGAKQKGHADMGYLAEDKAISIINYIGGRTYSSIARYASIYHIGFPQTREEYFSTLVNEYLDTVQKEPEKGGYPQMGLFLQDPTLKDLQSRYGDRAEEYFQVYQDFVARMSGLANKYITDFYEERLPEMTDFVKSMQQVDLNSMTNEQLVVQGIKVLEHIRTKSFMDFVYAARLGFYNSQRLQDLLKQRFEIGNDEAQRIFSKLNQGLDGSAITEVNIAIAEASSEGEALRVALPLVGHFSTGEMLEIRHKPLRDVPAALKTYVKGIRQTGQYKEQFERQKQARIQTQETLLSGLSEEARQELAKVIKSSQTYMALRETVKYLFTKEYLLYRDTLELLGSRLALRDGDIYFLYPREIPDLVSNPLSTMHRIRSRQQAFENYPQLDLPPVIRESDIDNLSLKEEQAGDFSEAIGKFLAEGSQIEGMVVNLDEFKDLEGARVAIEQYRDQNIPVILVATQMNLSHDPYIAQAAGLVIENAGIVAHGAQRARELGKGAIGGIKSKQLTTGMRVFFDPANRSIKKI
ncbi:hypothetical protein HY383_01360 [Candidatus Daviesbacteria bacterium]|nr:hypothetical protein [Candidatus Daviesbacteria bacterium]